MWLWWRLAQAGDLEVASCTDRACAADRIDAAWASLVLPDGPPFAGAPPPPEPLFDQEQRLIDAIEQSLARFSGDARSESLWLSRSGELFYRRNRFDEAAVHLSRAAVLFPADSQRAASLLLDVHNLRADWPALEQAARLFAELGVGDESFRSQLGDIEVAAAFRRLDRVDPSADLERAIDYLSIAERFPSHREADTALLNAAVLFERSGRTEDAIAARRRLLSREGGDDPRRHLSNLLSLAASCLRLGRLEEAASYYESAVASAPADPAFARDVADARFDAAVLRERLGQTEAATRLYESWLAAAPGDVATADVRLHVGELYLAAGRSAEAERALRAVPLDRDATGPWLLAQRALGGILEQRGRSQERDRVYARAVSVHASLPNPAEGPARTAVAEMQLALSGRERR